MFAMILACLAQQAYTSLSNQRSDSPRMIPMSMMTDKFGHTGLGLLVTRTATGHAAICSAPILCQLIPQAFLMGNLVYVPTHSKLLPRIGRPVAHVNAQPESGKERLEPRAARLHSPSSKHRTAELSHLN